MVGGALAELLWRDLGGVWDLRSLPPSAGGAPCASLRLVLARRAETPPRPQRSRKGTCACLEALLGCRPLVHASVFPRKAPSIRIPAQGPRAWVSSVASFGLIWPLEQTGLKQRGSETGGNSGLGWARQGVAQDQLS